MAMTDYLEKKIYYSEALSNSNAVMMLDDIRVLIHEICHCVLYSYGLLYDIHKAVKKDYWILAEEWICNFLCDYGLEAQQIGVDMLDEISQT